MGARTLLAATGYKVLELDGADADSREQLLAWVGRVRQLRTLQGLTAVVLDDFEGFTEETRRAVMTLLLSTLDDATLTPLVLTCTSYRDPVNRELLRPATPTDRRPALPHVKLRAPPERVVTQWFERSFPARRILAERALCATGDLRRVAIALQWPQFSATAGGGAVNRPITSSFDATRRLLTRRIATDEWLRHVEPREADLLREHVPRHLGEGEVDALAGFLEALSSADACQVERFELRAAHAHLPLTLAGAAARLTSHARDVGALAPPARPAASTDPAPVYPQSRPMRPAEWRDVPECLRDRA
jgi:hypothetical protein